MKYFVVHFFFSGFSFSFKILPRKICFRSFLPFRTIHSFHLIQALSRLLYIFIYMLYVFHMRAFIWSSLHGASPSRYRSFRQYCAFVISLSSQIPVSRRACIYSERNPRDRETTLEIFPSAYRRRGGAPLWKLGRNWPEFNPGIQFAVVFVPRGANPIDARACTADVFEI